jgi:hypothetical protein
MAFRVGIKKVIGTRVILVDAFLDEPEPENAGVKIEIFLGWTCNCGYVMESVYAVHDSSDVLG